MDCLYIVKRFNFLKDDYVDEKVFDTISKMSTHRIQVLYQRISSTPEGNYKHHPMREVQLYRVNNKSLTYLKLKYNNFDKVLQNNWHFESLHTLKEEIKKYLNLVHIYDEHVNTTLFDITQTIKILKINREVL